LSRDQPIVFSITTDDVELTLSFPVHWEGGAEAIRAVLFFQAQAQAKAKAKAKAQA
jgi:hypothetical protein